MAKDCKFEKWQKYISYDSGVTWSATTEYRMGDLIESASTDCGYVPPTPEAQYRWVNSGYTCVGYDKYQQQIKQVSYDSGSTWSNVVPNEFSATTLVESNSSYCGYVPPTPTGDKLYATYSGGGSRTVQCDGNSTLTNGNTQPSGYQYTAMTNAVIGSCVTSIERGAFQNCYSLTSVTIPTSVTSIGDNVFGNCSGLTSISIPTSVTFIGSAAFQYSKLTSLNIPNSVTRLDGSCLVCGCSSLTSVTIGNGVTYIGGTPFQYCNNLTSVTIMATTPPADFGSTTFNQASNMILYVPSGSLEAYRDKVSSSDKNRIQGI